VWSIRTLAVMLFGSSLVVPGNMDPRDELLAEKLYLRQQAKVQAVEKKAPVRPPAGGTANSDGAAPELPAVDPLLPAPAEVPPLWQGLDQTVREIAAGWDGRLSVTAIDLTSMVRYEFRPNDWYYPASTFKLPVSLCIAEAIDRDELTWESLVEFTAADDDSVGAGGFAEVDYGTRWPVRNLIDRSLVSSNNVAVKMLARTLTWDGLKACTERLGGPVTRTEEGSTPVTVKDEAAWWLALWRMKQGRPALAENLLRPLRRVTYSARIQAGTPRPDLVTHKFGSYTPYEHDGAIIWGDRPYLLVVMAQTKSHHAADAAIAQIARAAWDSVMGAGS
jgi:beta-lactamase class A